MKPLTVSNDQFVKLCEMSRVMTSYSIKNREPGNMMNMMCNKCTKEVMIFWYELLFDHILRHIAMKFQAAVLGSSSDEWKTTYEKMVAQITTDRLYKTPATHPIDFVYTFYQACMPVEAISEE